MAKYGVSNNKDQKTSKKSTNRSIYGIIPPVEAFSLLFREKKSGKQVEDYKKWHVCNSNERHKSMWTKDSTQEVTHSKQFGKHLTYL